MIGGLQKTASRVAMIAASGLIMGGVMLTPAAAADLGGDCCADLEERIAELEVTTVRKGTRKTTVTLYGHVNRALLYWDDGSADDVYSVENDNSQTRLGVRGSATPIPGIQFGYQIELGLERAASDRVTNADIDATDADDDDFIDLRIFSVYVKTARGKLSLGHLPTPSTGITEVDLSGTKVIATGRGIRWNNSFRPVVAGAPVAATWGNQSAIRGHMGGTRYDIIRYDTPTIRGFTASVAWGEDDLFDVALRWAGEVGDFRAAMGISYRVQNGNQLSTDGYSVTGVLGGDSDDAEGNNGTGSKIVAGSIGVLHAPTGLNLHFAAGQTEHDNNNAPGSPTWNDTTFWYIKGGIKQKFFAMGPTALYGEYQKTNDANSGTASVAHLSTVAAGVYVTDEELSYWGLGVVQHIPAAATEIYLGYRKYSTSETYSNGTTVDSQDLDMVMGGMRVKF